MLEMMTMTIPLPPLAEYSIQFRPQIHNTTHVADAADVKQKQ